MFLGLRQRGRRQELRAEPWHPREGQAPHADLQVPRGHPRAHRQRSRHEAPAGDAGWTRAAGSTVSEHGDLQSRGWRRVCAALKRARGYRQPSVGTPALAKGWIPGTCKQLRWSSVRGAIPGTGRQGAAAQPRLRPGLGPCSGRGEMAAGSPGSSSSCCQEAPEETTHSLQKCE